jgi:Cdc6-like AAA superfamily ATPase
MWRVLLLAICLKSCDLQHHRHARQLLAIMTARLAALPPAWRPPSPTVFDPAGLELVARKVAAGSGDVRKALQASDRE